MADEVREFKLPDLGEGLTEAEIVSWIVKEGDSVDLNQPIVEVETEKAIVEIPSPFEGTIEKLHGDVGERVQVGAALVSIKTSGDAPQTGRREVLVGYGPDEGKKKRRRKIGKRNAAEEAEADEVTEDEVEEEEETVVAKQEAAPAPAKRAGGRSLATPPVRKLARDLGVDIDRVSGSGSDGRVTREDVEAAASGAKDKPAAAAAASSEGAKVVPLQPVERRAAGEESEERIPVRSIRRSIAKHMVRSYSEIPHVTEWCTIDATELMQLREQLNAAPEAEGNRISPLALMVKALPPAIRKYPNVNSSWEADGDDASVVVKGHVHVGIATDTDRGLIVPVLKHADQLNVFEIAREIKRLVEATRGGQAGLDEIRGSTITITNVGSFGMESGTPIINSPETGIIALGAIVKRPWVVNDEIVPRYVMTLAFTFDHRVLDGAYAGRFLRYLGDLLENPARLLGTL